MVTLSGRRQGKISARNWSTTETDKQLVHQPKEEKLAQQSFKFYKLEKQTQKVQYKFLKIFFEYMSISFLYDF